MYAITLGSLEPGTTTKLESFSPNDHVKNVSILGAVEAVEWNQTDGRLEISVPRTRIESPAVVSKIDLT